MSLRKALLGAMNCPVCLEPPRKVPVPHCPNGHHVCRDCLAKIRACPVCRDPRMNSRSLMADAMVESMPLPCRFKAHGCSSREIPKMERELHEETCKFREVECPESKCKDRVSLPSLLDHLKGHYKPEVATSNGEKISIYLPDGITGYWFSDHYCVDEADFVDKFMYQDNEWHWWVYFLGTREEAKKFKVKLDLENKIGDTISFVFSPISIDVPKDDVIQGGLDFVMTNRFVQKFVDGNEVFYTTTIQQRNITVSVSGLPMPASVQAAGPTEDPSDQALDPPGQGQNPPGLTEDLSGQALDPPGQGQNPPGQTEESSSDRVVN